VSGPNKGIGQKNMNLTKINLLTVKETVKVTEFDENNKKSSSHLEQRINKATIDLTTGEIEIKEEDGTGMAISIDPKIINAVIGWINGNIERANAREQARENREIMEHAQRMRETNARAAEAELRLEEAQLKHEIHMVELRTELAERKKQLREAEADLEENPAAE